MLETLDRFSTHLKQAINAAIKFTLHHKQPQITPLALFWGLLQEKGSLAADLLQRFNLSGLDFNIPAPLPSLQPSYLPELSPASKTILLKAALHAEQLKHYYIGTEHLLKALLNAPTPEISALLTQKKITLTALQKELDSILSNTSKLQQFVGLFTENSGEHAQISALEFFGVNLTNPTIQNSIDPVIGREQEIERLIHILSRRTKNNPILIGEPGVGKTAIVEGLAKRILEKKVPDILLNKKIYKLDLSLVVAGTMYRGEFEARFKQIIEELRQHSDIIIFIDEIHTLIGAGSAGAGGGSMDAANILKPALAKGEISCIGATTLEEYRKHIESDPALERRFQSILVEEPSLIETQEILAGLKHNYEQYHQIGISEAALTAAVELSVRYLQDKFLPDKALDLIDEAAARAKIKQPLSAKRLLINELEEKIKFLQEKKYSLIKLENFTEAIKLKNKEQELETQIKNLKHNPSHTQKFSVQITAQDIAVIIAQITGIPVGELLTSEKEKILDLQKNLEKKIIGQTAVISEVSKFLKRARAGLTAPERPLASFIFLGPSGVGKTELAKVLSKELFGNEKSLLRLDMSEYKESFNISKLIGAPAGYIGYKEGAKLTEFVKRKPYSVILLDEIEKAHPDIFNLLLQILEDGQLTDATGKKINFKNTIIIMTSNIGLADFLHQAEIGFAEQTQPKILDYEKIKSHTLQELKKHFRPEFINRVDKLLVFQPLTLPLVMEISKLQIFELQKRLAEKNITLEVPLAIHKWLATKSFTPEEGARALRRCIQEYLETPLAEKILQGTLNNGMTIKIKIKNSALTFSV